MRREALVALAVLAGAWAAILWLKPFSNDSISDLYVYRRFGESVRLGALPYRDILFEYPPFAAPVLLIPALFGTGAEVFRMVFGSWMLLIAAATLLMTGAIATRTGGSRRAAMLAVAVAPLLCGAMIRTHFDLAPVALLVAALLAICDGRRDLGAILLGVAALTKGFPLFAAVPVLAWLYARYGAAEALRTAGVLAAVVLLGCAFAVIASPAGARETLHYQTDRPVQVESSPASVLLLLQKAGVGHSTKTSSNLSDGIHHPAASATAGAFFGLLAITLGLLARAAYRNPTPRSLVAAALATAPAFAVFGKVLSPQYMVWIVPLGALALAWRRYALAAAVAAAVALTQVEFPSRYFDVVAEQLGPLLLVAARNLVLVAVVVLSLLEVSRPEPGPARSPWLARPRLPRSAPRSATGPLPRSRT